MTKRHRAVGFTLIELLVVLVVFSLLAVMSYRGLSTVLDTRAHVKLETDKWHRVSMFLSRFGQDLAFSSPRVVRNPADAASSLPAVLGDPEHANGGFTGPYLEFSRYVFADGIAGPQRLAYTINGKNEIELWLWPSLDNGPGTTVNRYVVLSDVALLEVKYLDDNLMWAMSWPPTPAAATLPRAVQVRIVLATGEDISRVFAL